MKTLVRLSMVAVLISTFGIMFAQAQDYGRGPGQGRGPGRGHGHGFGPDSCHLQLMVNDLAKEIGLSEKQEKEILELHYAHLAEMKSINTQYKSDCVGARDARIASREKMDESIKKVLTEEQAGLYDKFMESRRGPHGPQGHPGGKGKRK